MQYDMDAKNEQQKIIGLTTQEVAASATAHGRNRIDLKEQRVLLHVLKEVALEPMFIILLATCVIYFVVGQLQEGIIMLIAIFLVAGISLFQEYRSRNAINALKKLSAPHATVLRNGTWQQIATEEIVVDDILRLEEGELVAADGLLLTANDLSVNESILTGEAFAVQKIADGINIAYKGTLVVSGGAILKVQAVGSKTMFGKIGLSLQEIAVVKTPLQLQIKSFVKNMVWIGAVAFVVVVGMFYFQTHEIMASLLHGLTLAMSVLPEEIPVAFSTFQALGAFRLLRSSIIVKQPQYVETLGSATVICADKTGTLTENEMRIVAVFDAAAKKSIAIADTKDLPAIVLEYAMWSSETTAFDPMEKAIHALYESTAKTDERLHWKQVHEYPIGGTPPMMTHVFKNGAGQGIIAAKGAPEAILKHSTLSSDAVEEITKQVMLYATQGLRVLGVGKAIWTSDSYPASQEEFNFEFLGLIAFQDPPKKNITATIETFRKAGIRVNMITGDYAETALAIAAQINLTNNTAVLTGKEVLAFSPAELQQKVKDVNIYARMFPEAKLKVITALKDNGEVVAMTGDGVNDGPALKAAHIGIAMGKRGSEVAKSAASLILTDDDLSHMTDAVALGRKIYDNLQKAIRYIVSIHIPIILIVTLPLVLMWKFNAIFSPVHVIFLELIMGPTCSIIYENEPMEPNTMQRPPRPLTQTFLTGRQLLLSIIQGLVITGACLGIGYYYMQHQQSEEFVRTSIFITLLFCNIFLTLVNRSFYYSVLASMKHKNYLVPGIIAVIALLIVLLLYVPAVQSLFATTTVPLSVVAMLFAISFVSTMWLEVWKMVKRKGKEV
jgi:P-type Ca2+ transporter type 2C